MSCTKHILIRWLFSFHLGSRACSNPHHTKYKSFDLERKWFCTLGTRQQRGSRRGGGSNIPISVFSGPPIIKTDQPGTSTPSPSRLNVAMVMRAPCRILLNAVCLSRGLLLPVVARCDFYRAGQTIRQYCLYILSLSLSLPLYS